MDMPRKRPPREGDPLPRLRANLPQQARSRLTVHRLVSATEALLAQGGLDAATVPAIASLAGVSVGVVYRRFPDKDNLLRAVYDRFFERVKGEHFHRLGQEGYFDMTLPQRVRSFIRTTVELYRTNRGILRALQRYARTHPDSTFRRSVRKESRLRLGTAASVLLVHREQIAHPNPEAAVELALVAVVAVLNAILLEDEPLGDFRTPDHLDEELTRMFLRYLGIEEEAL
jgi:AcrR family transcriptional regulator